LANVWSAASNHGLFLPPPNQFIPRNFTIIPPPSTAQKYPTKIDTTQDGMSIWWLQDTEFVLPKLDIVCDINTNTNTNSTRWAALNMLYSSIVTLILNPELYPATLVGYTVSVKSTTKGVTLTLNGYSDPSVMNHILSSLTDGMTNKSLLTDPHMLSLALETLKLQLTNYNYTALPYHYVYQYIQKIVMERPAWKKWQILSELKSLQMPQSDISSHVDSLFNSSSLICFFHGNADKTQTLSYAQMLHKLIQPLTVSSDDPTGSFDTLRLSLSPGNYSVIVPSLNPNDVNSVVNVVFQIGRSCDIVSGTGNCSQDSLKRKATADLLTLGIMQSCFDVLRSQQQLGYVAYCTLRTNNDVASFQVLVQSGTYNASLVLDRINQFLSNSLQNVTQFFSVSSQFQILKQVYITSVLNKKDLDIVSKTTRLWKYIYTGLNQFDYNDQIKNVLDSITGQDVVNFYNSYIVDNSSSKKLVIAVYGLGKRQTLDAFITHPLNYTNIDPLANSYP
jgi:insulysin